jgi:hypothetical protein
MKIFTVRKLFRAALVAGCLGSAVPAFALSINLIDIGGVTGSQAEKGFAIAASYWESVLTNNATVNINVGFSDLGPKVLGGTSTALYTYVPIETYKGLLAVNSDKSQLDMAAILPGTSPSGSVAVTVPGYVDSANQLGISSTAAPRIAPDGTPIANTIAIASSNVKALVNDAGFDATGIDAQIEFSSSFAFDFDPTDAIAAGTYDFIGVAVHEIGHALGFLSGAQDFDYSTDYTSFIDPDTGETVAFNPDDYWWGYAGDLFRYSAEGKLDWTFGTDSYFSLDGGKTAFLGGNWSTGEVNGDTWQASHWKAPGGCTDFLGIMNPYICNGLTDQTTALDLGYLDAIGWNTNVDVAITPGYTFTTAQMFQAFGAVPEPSTWAMMIGGLGLVGASLRQRRARALASA